MSNLKRHFNFNGKHSLSQDPFVSSKSPFSNFDKMAMMNNICNCLDLCCSYIQALNSLCSAGSSLAKSLLFAVKDAPAYQNISLQFLSVWEEISKATAGASAAVKTETLMLLQEVLNSLEVCSNDANHDDIVLNSFHAVGSCICSFIELQSQFSWSTWKSLSKLSKYFANDAVKPSLSLQWKAFEKNPSKIYANTDLNSTIKSFYCKIGVQKINESLSSVEKQCHSAAISSQVNVPMCQFTSDNSQNSVSADSLWSSTIWSSKTFSGASPESDLDEVINLLSCVPVQQSVEEMQNKNLMPYTVSGGQSKQTIVDSQISSGAFHTNKTWPIQKRTDDSLCWHVYDLNISRNSETSRSQVYEKFLKQWENDIQMWNASSTETNSSGDDASMQYLESYVSSSDRSKLIRNSVSNLFRRKSQIGESMPDNLENISEFDESTMGLQSKINTWPLKQTSNQDLHEL